MKRCFMITGLIMAMSVLPLAASQNIISRNLDSGISEKELSQLWYDVLLKSITPIDINKTGFYNIIITLIDDTTYTYSLQTINIEKLKQDVAAPKSIFFVLPVTSQSILSSVLIIRAGEIKSIQIKATS